MSDTHHNEELEAMLSTVLMRRVAVGSLIAAAAATGALTGCSKDEQQNHPNPSPAVTATEKLPSGSGVSGNNSGHIPNSGNQGGVKGPGD